MTQASIAIDPAGRSKEEFLAQIRRAEEEYCILACTQKTYEVAKQLMEANVIEIVAHRCDGLADEFGVRGFGYRVPSFALADACPVFSDGGATLRLSAEGIDYPCGKPSGCGAGGCAAAGAAFAPIKRAAFLCRQWGQPEAAGANQGKKEKPKMQEEQTPEETQKAAVLDRLLPKLDDADGAIRSLLDSETAGFVVLLLHGGSEDLGGFVRGLGRALSGSRAVKGLEMLDCLLSLRQAGPKVLNVVTAADIALLDERLRAEAVALLDKATRPAKGWFCLICATHDEYAKLKEALPQLEKRFLGSTASFDSCRETGWESFLDNLSAPLRAEAERDAAVKASYLHAESKVSRECRFSAVEAGMHLALESNRAGKISLGRYAEETVDGLMEPIVGCDAAKEMVRSIQSSVAFRIEAERRGIALPPQSLHMLFLGSPGTGKTTFARIVARALFEAGAIKRDSVVETCASGLIAAHVGETALKTRSVIDSAKGGVLFIDEAYALAIGDHKVSNSSDFGMEAIAELVKAMEDEKGDLVVILAGYPEQTRAMVDVNPGMRSRIGYTLTFDDYSADELTEMYTRLVEGSGMGFGEGAKAEAERTIAQMAGAEQLGNGRFVQRLFQETISRHSKSFDSQSFEVIGCGDIPSAGSMRALLGLEEPGSRKVGFCR